MPEFASHVMNRGSVAHAAASLAATYEPPDLAAAFTGQVPDEFRACLIQELVLRGVGVTGIPELANWVASPQWRQHPLSWLPLTLSELEARVNQPSSPGADRGGPAVGARVPLAQEATVATERLAKAVQGWDQVEAKAFDFAEPLGAAAIPSALVTLGLTYLSGLDDTSAFTTQPCPPELVWSMLFTAATHGIPADAVGGRVPDPRPPSAYARLKAWQSIAGLAGAPDEATATEVQARVRDCTWHSFVTDIRCHCGSDQQLGVAAVGPDCRRLTVLAATVCEDY